MSISEVVLRIVLSEWDFRLCFNINSWIMISLLILFRIHMQEEKVPMTGEMQDLLEFSEALGVLKFVNGKTIENFKLAFEPMITTSKYYETLGKYS